MMDEQNGGWGQFLPDVMQFIFTGVVSGPQGMALLAGRKMLGGMMEQEAPQQQPVEKIPTNMDRYFDRGMGDGTYAGFRDMQLSKSNEHSNHPHKFDAQKSPVGRRRAPGTVRPPAPRPSMESRNPNPTAPTGFRDAL